MRTVAGTVIEPVRDQRPDSDITAFNADQLASVVRVAASTSATLLVQGQTWAVQWAKYLLCLPDRDSRRVDAISYTRDEPTNDKLSSSAVTRGYGCELDDDTDDHDYATQENTFPTTEFITEGKNEQSAKEASDSVDGDDEALPVRVAVDLGEVLYESIASDNTGHDTLIVTKQQEIEGRDGGDESLERLARLAPVGGHAIGVFLVPHSS